MKTALSFNSSSACGMDHLREGSKPCFCSLEQIRPDVHTAGVGGEEVGGMDEPSGSSIDRLLADCRRDLERVPPARLAEEVERGALVVDTRPVHQRERDGELPGAVVVDRNVLEWRLDPTSPSRLPIVDGPPRRVVVVCDEGYSSSLAAHNLRLLGLDATDLEGGFQAWLVWSRGEGG
jgi:rhodanese-related sulfurtransferase